MVPKIKFIPVPRRARERVWSAREREAIVEALGHPHPNPAAAANRLLTRDIVQIALGTSMRIGEICGLRKVAVRIDEGLIVTRSAKSPVEQPKDKRIPLTPVVEEILRRRIKESGCEFVFALAGRWKPESITHIVYVHLRSACKRARVRYGRDVLGGLVFHDTRHTATTQMVADKVDLGVIQEITGHSEATMVLYYTHATSVDAARASLAKTSVVRASSAEEDGPNEETTEIRKARRSHG